MKELSPYLLPPHLAFLCVYGVFVTRFSHVAASSARRPQSSSLKFKLALNMLLTVLHLVDFVVQEILAANDWAMAELIVALSWAASAHLLLFFYHRKLPWTWPHRLYWVLALLFELVIFVLSLVHNAPPTLVVMDSVELALLTCLALMHLFLPQDYILQTQLSLPPTLLQFSQKPKAEPLSAQIYKQSVLAESGEVLFHLRTFEAGRPMSQKIRKTLLDFLDLDARIRFKYVCQLPELPTAPPASFSELPAVQVQLNSYLTALVSSSALTRQTLDFLKIPAQKASRLLIQQHQEADEPPPSPRSVENAKMLLRLIWEREEAVNIEVRAWARDTVLYFIRVTSGLSQMHNSFQTEMSLPQLHVLHQQIVRRVKKGLPFPPLPVENTPAAAEEIRAYLLWVTNDPAYYCRPIFQLLPACLAPLLSLEALFDGSLAHLESIRRTPSPEPIFRQGSYRIQSRSHTEPNRPLRTDEISFKSVHAGTGEGCDSMCTEEEQQQASSSLQWWDENFQTQFSQFVGLDYRLNLINAEVRLGKDNQFHLVFSLQIHKYEQESITATWEVMRTDRDFYELDTVLVARFPQEMIPGCLKVDAVSQTSVAKRAIHGYLGRIMQINGLLNCLAARGFLGVGEGATAELLASQQDYFDLRSQAPSHQEALLQPPTFSSDYFR